MYESVLYFTMQVFNILNLWQVSDLGTTVSFTNKTGRHDITEILLKVALITIALTPYNLNLILCVLFY